VPSVREHAVATAGGARRAAARSLDRTDPSLRRALKDLSAPPPLALVAVYRRRNAGRVATLVAGLPAGSPVALWALEDEAPELAEWTVGSGPGIRFALLNRCIAALDPAPDRWLLACDDDIAFSRGTPTDLVRIARAADLGLSMPAHAYGSFATHAYVRRQRGVVARRGRFVEIGPFLVLSPAGRRLVLPFPEDADMGWGVEALWAALEADGLRLGIVDAVHIDHLEAPGGSYDVHAERTVERSRLALAGVASVEELHVDHERWTSRHPPSQG
jgi:hypothetical protein